MEQEDQDKVLNTRWDKKIKNKVLNKRWNKKMKVRY